PAEKVELPVRVEAGFAAVDALQRSQPPGAEERGDPRCPRPLAHAVKSLAILDLMAVDELFVREDVPVGMHDALRKSRRPRGVVELRRVVGEGRFADLVLGGTLERALLDEKQLGCGMSEAWRVRRIGG